MATIFSVKIHYGPCKSFYSYTHKPGKLTGLRDRLQTMGYRVQLVPEKFENYCMIEMCGHEVFRCNQTNLMFNTPFYRDPVCQRAVAAVHEASTKLCRARNRLWLIKLLSNRTFSNNPYRLVNHWPEKYELEPYAPVFRCNLKYLKFNTHWSLDPVCQRAIDAVSDAATKLNRSRNRLWLKSVLINHIFDQHHLVNHWPQKHELKPYAPLSVCLDCCGVCSTKK